MARGVRREVRNDFPGVSEPRDHMILRTRDGYFNRTKPSANKPKSQREVPPGCISVYRVHLWDGKRSTYFGVFRDPELAYQVADAEWKRLVTTWSWSSTTKMRVHVEHKAAMLIEERFYIVNLDPIKFTPPVEMEPPTQEVANEGG